MNATTSTNRRIGVCGCLGRLLASPWLHWRLGRSCGRRRLASDTVPRETSRVLGVAEYHLVDVATVGATDYGTHGIP